MITRKCLIEWNEEKWVLIFFENEINLSQRKIKTAQQNTNSRIYVE